MRASVRIGRLAGIDVRVHASFALLVGLVALAATAPGGPSVLSQFVWIVVLFASVVVHELAHSLVARRRGIEVTEIDLLPIGGLSRLRSLPRDPRGQFDVAIAGPLASVVIGLAGLALAAAAGVTAWPPDLVEGPLVVRLAWANLLLAAFNLVPAFPLDGGRVLRALLAGRMDGDAATMAAGRIGRILAGAMMLAGLAFNFWLLVIGLFVYFGSMAEESTAVVRRALGGLRVSDVMVRFVPPDVACELGEPVDADSLVVDTDLLGSKPPARPAIRGDQVVGYVTRPGLTAVVEARVSDWYRLRSGLSPFNRRWWLGPPSPGSRPGGSAPA
jgi:Zn-dependent protease